MALENRTKADEGGKDSVERTLQNDLLPDVAEQTWHKCEKIETKRGGVYITKRFVRA